MTLPTRNLAVSSFGAGIVMGLPDADLLSLLDIAEAEANRRGLVAEAPIEPGTEAFLRQIEGLIHHYAGPGNGYTDTTRERALKTAVVTLLAAHGIGPRVAPTSVGDKLAGGT